MQTKPRNNDTDNSDNELKALSDTAENSKTQLDESNSQDNEVTAFIKTKK
ncbi:MAG: hypothetical protein AB7F64_07840 [Gammaproteobacteria bacterium]